MRLFLFLFALFFTACSSAPDGQQAATDSSVSIRDTSIQDEAIQNPPPAPPPSEVKDSTLLDRWRVYTDIYGTNFCNADNELLILAEGKEFTSYDGYQHIVLDSLIRFNVGNTMKALAVWHSNVYEEEGQRLSCHSCGAPMGLALYQKAGEVWRLEKYDPYIEEYGSYGLLPEYGLQEAAPGKFMFILKPGFTGQGITFTSDVFISLPQLEVCFSLDTHEDNRGAVDETDPEGYSWDAVYTWLPQADSGLVLEVTTKGDLPKDKPYGKTIYAWNQETGKLEKR